MGEATRKLTKAVGKAVVDYGKSAVKKYKRKRDPKLVVAGVNPKATLGSDDFEKSEKVVRKYGRAKLATGIAAGYTIGATEAPSKVWDGAKYTYNALTEKKARDSKKGSTTTTKPAASSSTNAKKVAANKVKVEANKVTQARKQQMAATAQKNMASAAVQRATTNKAKLAANKAKVAANSKEIAAAKAKAAANKKKVAANTARYKK
jgi:hypothetical protein